MPPKKSQKNTEKRTRSVKIVDRERDELMESPLQRVLTPERNQSYELHIEHTPEHTPGKPVGPQTISGPTNLSAEKLKTLREKQRGGQMQKASAGPGRAGRGIGQGHSGQSISSRIWNVLEWFATSALIFMVFFFILNFGSYSELVKSKFEKLTGGFKLSPYIEKMLGQEPSSQELLPVAATVSESIRQIPPIAIDVAPPDDRIIIPRINKNVPIVPVSTENLIKRDWSALETDIQGALQGGVVHYPGTAEPGDFGNVVITGHSSYFPWDPGRFKDVFALLHQVAIGDRIIVYHEQRQYAYEVYDTVVVTPDKVDVLTQEGGDRLTLITCTPVGTNLKRLIVLARPA